MVPVTMSVATNSPILLKQDNTPFAHTPVLWAEFSSRSSSLFSLSISGDRLKSPALTGVAVVLAGGGDLSRNYQREHEASPCGLGSITAWWLGSMVWHLQKERARQKLCCFR